MLNRAASTKPKWNDGAILILLYDVTRVPNMDYSYAKTHLPYTSMPVASSVGWRYLGVWASLQRVTETEAKAKEAVYWFRCVSLTHLAAI